MSESQRDQRHQDASDTLIASVGSGPPSSDDFAPMSGIGPQLLAGRYEILGLVGVGGMGSVYRVRDLELEEVVALKVLRRDLNLTPDLLDGFKLEVKLARRVTHRNVARVFDIGEHEGERFLTMELIDGEPLSAALAKGGPLPILRGMEIAAGVAAGLAGAHAVGVVHRDLKPDNVLLATDGRVVVTDFGIARALADAGGAVKAGDLVGTPAYMSPEQVEGLADIDGRADIYALGTLLYELVTGTRTWPGDSAYSVASARLVSPPPDPRAKRPSLPIPHAEFILRCMARRREDRYASALDVISEIERLAQPTVPHSRKVAGEPTASGRGGAYPGPPSGRADSTTSTGMREINRDAPQRRSSVPPNTASSAAIESYAARVHHAA